MACEIGRNCGQRRGSGGRGGDGRSRCSALHCITICAAERGVMRTNRITLKTHVSWRGRLPRHVFLRGARLVGGYGTPTGGGSVSPPPPARPAPEGVCIPAGGAACVSQQESEKITPAGLPAASPSTYGASIAVHCQVLRRCQGQARGEEEHAWGGRAGVDRGPSPITARLRPCSQCGHTSSARRWRGWWGWTPRARRHRREKPLLACATPRARGHPGCAAHGPPRRPDGAVRSPWMGPRSCQTTRHGQGMHVRMGWPRPRLGEAAESPRRRRERRSVLAAGWGLA